MNENKKAIVVGAFAGLVPSAINLLNCAPESIFTDFDGIRLCGRVFQAILLMGLGAFIVLLNKEKNLIKAFQLGIAAPAIFIGYVNGTAVNNANQEVRELTHPAEISMPSSQPISYFNGIVSVAYAQEFASETTYLKQSSVGKRFWYGLTGNMNNSWFVIAGSHKSEQSALNQVQELKIKGYDAELYNPYSDSEYFGVVIGSYLSLDEAKKLKAKAVKDGLPKDIYLWKWR